MQHGAPVAQYWPGRGQTARSAKAQWWAGGRAGGYRAAPDLSCALARRLVWVHALAAATRILRRPPPCGAPPRGPRRRTVGAPPAAPARIPAARCRHAEPPAGAQIYSPPWGGAPRPRLDAAGRCRPRARACPGPCTTGHGCRGQIPIATPWLRAAYGGSVVLSPRAHSADADAIAVETGATPPRPRSAAVALRDEPRPESAPGCPAWPLVLCNPRWVA